MAKPEYKKKIIKAEIEKLNKDFNMISLFGYTQEEIHKFVLQAERIKCAKECYDFDLDKAIAENFNRKNYKMTREEARQKIIQYKYNPEFLNMLEALGLIKFEEEKKDDRIVTFRAYQLIEKLKALGYIVDKPST